MVLRVSAFISSVLNPHTPVDTAVEGFGAVIQLALLIRPNGFKQVSASLQAMACSRYQVECQREISSDSSFPMKNDIK